MRRVVTPLIEWAPALIAFCLTAVLLAGWLASYDEPVTPKAGLGYWLGIAGASMMALSLAYYIRKRLATGAKSARALPSWFRLHVISGVAGPALILFHCNFRLGAFNSNVALLSMGAVVASGVVGRYLYRFAYHSEMTALERVFAAWRLLHAPLCVVLIVSALVHIWAVHRF
ncbi:hypothetical protein F7D14_03640 [Methylocystis parvus]|uniref:Uncharacterized protein n=1 Tax=Methylocystis parvus TaxID=134 RepID=A0A6B8MA76_9HYPH|nr:hypothetical protein F7D14_03640 [Methylocystis parvus]